MSTFRIIHADVLDGLSMLQDASVHCCVTSPPYWGLRDYGTAEWNGGLPDCDHVYNHGVQGKTGRRSDRTFTAQAVYKHDCRKCGATRIDKQLGLERTPEEYVAAMVAVFREVRRVLRPDGSCWINLGDSYANTGGAERRMSLKSTIGRSHGGQGEVLYHAPSASFGIPSKEIPANLKPKDLVGIPWRVAFALQADGWYLRSDIIWHKPNPMPESVTDRPTKAHEYLFLLTKSERYAYDAAAIAEPAGIDSAARYLRGRSDVHKYADGGPGGQTICRSMDHMLENPDTRNKRTVWSVTSEPYAEAHFAVMPTALVEPCVMAGCPEGGTVLDPFAGSGTVGVVALRHARDFIGIELNAEYVEMARRRIQEDMPMFNAEIAV